LARVTNCAIDGLGVQRLIRASSAAQTFLRSKEVEFASAAHSDVDKRDYGSAVYDYTKAIKLGLDDPTFYSRRGDTRQSMGDVDGAIGDLSEAIRLCESREHTWAFGTTADWTATMYDMRGAAKAKVGDFDGAIKDFTKAIQLVPSQSPYYGHRSDARRSRGDSRGADEDLAAANRLKPAPSGLTVKDAPPNATALQEAYKAGLAALQSQDFKTAADRFQKAAEKWRFRGAERRTTRQRRPSGERPEA
jgi:tetratricopeptide (TPR) repeat protein